MIMDTVLLLCICCPATTLPQRPLSMMAVGFSQSLNALGKLFRQRPTPSPYEYAGVECNSGSYSDGKETKYRKIIKSLNWSNRKKLTTRDYIMDHALLGLSQSVSEVSVRYGDYCNFIPWTCYPVPCIRYSQLSTKHYTQSLHPSLHRVVHHFQRFVGLRLHHLCWWCGSSLIDSDQVAQIKGKYSSIVC